MNVSWLSEVNVWLSGVNVFSSILSIFIMILLRDKYINIIKYERELGENMKKYVKCGDNVR